MLDHLLRGGTIIDGTGTPAFRGDVGIKDGRIVAVGSVDEPAANVVDVTGLVVCPGFIDPHTHYDAQLFWDPYATPSNVHGVTSMIGGNCGFTIAPLKPEDADYIRRLLARVEGMPLGALESGIDWKWRTFGEYLDRLDGNLGVNVGFLVGHSALRRYVMGKGAVGGEATPEQVADMQQVLDDSLAAGGLGLSTSLSSTHTDGDGEPVPSRWSGRDELIALCEVTGRHEGTTLEGITSGCLDWFSDDEVRLFTDMSMTANRPLNWNLLVVDPKHPDRLPHQLGAADSAATQGGRLVALTMPVLVPLTMSLLTYCALHQIPGWTEILSLPVPERIAKLRDPAVRAGMLERLGDPAASRFRTITNFKNFVIGTTFSPENEGLQGRVVGDIARERHQNPFDCMVEITINDDLRTVLWPPSTDRNPDNWKLRASAWSDPRTLLGGSDAGAHLDRMFGAGYTTRFLGDVWRGHRLVSMEDAVQMITDTPARLFGLRDRGRLAEGWIADVVVFDPATVDSDDAALVPDLPGGSSRLTGQSRGIVRVLVNGVETVRNGKATGALPGTLLRSGRHTDTVTAR